MDFCPRCGRYLKDNEFQCPECGNIVRQPRFEPQPEESFGQPYPMRPPQRIDLKKAIFEKYFFIALGIAFAASFLVTYYWRFTLLFFCIPLFIPMGRISISLGTMAGISLGCAAGILSKVYLVNTAIV